MVSQARLKRFLFRNRQRKVLAALMHERGGRCERCGVRVGVVRKLVKQGWEHLQPAGVLVRGGEALAVATVDHVVPLSADGENEWGNYRLYCHACNWEVSPIAGQTDPAVRDCILQWREALIANDPDHPNSRLREGVT